MGNGENGPGLVGVGVSGVEGGGGEGGVLCEGDSAHFCKGEGDQGPEGRVRLRRSVRLFL